ncbi:F-box/SPRY domain-containing protein 1 [Orchesella cincta]|uniref:F-box/SPRY domain-containing protein 1 n=1 Tax=Orchesella cincta TaxID=48709 RepID=A0A1D2N7R5_ORCCI|nr:F-box/SPRY domain-containing protein 1 [Orchesella cincta]
MSSPGHSRDPGKSHDRDNKDDKNQSPSKWKHPSAPSPSSGSPTNAGPSKQQQQQHTNPLLNFASGKPALNFKKLFNHTFGKEEHNIPQAQALPIRNPLLSDLDHDKLGADAMVGNGLPNGSHLHDVTSDNSGTENYSDDHESGSSNAGGQESGRNSNQSPSDSCGIQTHISALPENVLENIFSFIDLGDIRNVALVCQEWNRVIGDENNEVWRTQCFKRMSREIVYSDLLTSCPTFKAKLRAHIHSWNPLDCSRNIYVKPNGFTIHRNPVAQSTDGARGKIGFNRGRHAWEIIWEGPLGTVAVVGVATQQAEVRAQGYIALLGKDDQSWGWNLVENLLLHNGDSQGNYPVINNAPRYQVGERIRVILDCEDNTLSFEKNFEFLGVAFRGLPNREMLFPAVSAVYGNTEISMVYLGPPLDG